MDQNIQKAVEIVDKLQDWIENRDDLCSVPIANCWFSASVLLGTY